MRARPVDILAWVRRGRCSPFWWNAGIIFAVALVVRVAYVFFIDGSYALDVGDQAAYDRIARVWLEEGKFMPGSSYRPPAYPVFVAGVYWLFGVSRQTVELVQAILGAVTVLLVVQLGRRLCSPIAAALTGWVTALMPVLVHFVAQLMAETIFTTLLVLLLWIVVRDDQGKNIWSAVWVGALVGVGALMRPNVLLLPVALVCWWRWGTCLPTRKAVARAALCLTVAMVTILPWSIRNLSVHKVFVPVSTNGGVNLWIGNNEYATGDWLKPGDYWSPHGANEAEVDQQYYLAALHFMFSHPGRTVRLVPRKLWIFWTPYPHLSDQVPFLLLFPVSLVGLGVSLRRRETWILLVAVGYFTLVSCVFFANQRFHVPLLPVVAIYAGMGAERLWSWVTGWHYSIGGGER